MKLVRIYTEKGLRLESARKRVTSIHRAAEKGNSRKPSFRYYPILGNSGALRV